MMPIISLLLLLALALPASSQTPKKVPIGGTGATADGLILIALENKWVDALQKADTATLDSILSETYVDTDDQGQRSDKQGIFSVLKSGDLKFESVRVSDMRVYAYGPAAVVTGTGVQRGTFKGDPITTRIVFTDTFIKQNGNWRAVSSHRSVAPGGNATPSNGPHAIAGSDDAEIRALVDRWAKVFEAHDVEGIMSLYAPGDAVMAYDVVPPLVYKGKDAYRKDYVEFLAQYDGPVHVEFRDMRVLSSGDVGFVHALERFTGKLKNGQQSDLWLRATSGVRKMNGKWLIVHDHVSVPIDFESGKAVLNLKP
jgi:uncharacterized protein (TIGR02246 family)